MVFCFLLGTKIIKLNKEHEGKIRVVYDTAVGGYKEVWVEQGTNILLDNISVNDINWIP